MHFALGLSVVLDQLLHVKLPRFCVFHAVVFVKDWSVFMYSSLCTYIAVHFGEPLKGLCHEDFAILGQLSA